MFVSERSGGPLTEVEKIEEVRVVFHFCQTVQVGLLGNSLRFKMSCVSLRTPNPSASDNSTDAIRDMMHFFVAIFFAVVFSISAFAESVQSGNSQIVGLSDDPWASCRGVGTCRMMSDSLSEQKDDPFLFLGHVIDQDSARWRQYAGPIRRHPDVTSCLVMSEQAEDAPNLLSFDWDRVDTGHDAEVCVFRILRSLDDTREVEKWLAFHGFKFKGRTRRFSSGFKPQFADQPITSITAVWTIERYRELNPNILSMIFGVEWLQSYQLVISFNDEGRVVSVGAVTPSK